MENIFFENIGNVFGRGDSMNRQEFMKRLEELLNGISSEEREEALAYYRNYFEDAGAENEEKVLRELESPEKLAASIKAGLQEDGVYTESTTDKEPLTGEVVERGRQENFQHREAFHGNASQDRSGQKKTDNTTLIVVLIVVAVVTSPVWIGMLGGIFGVLLGIVGALVGLTIGFLVGGFVCVGVGITYLCVANVPLGLLALGCGGLLLAVGILTLLLLVQFCGRFLPWAVRGIVRLFQSIFHGSRKEQRV